MTSAVRTAPHRTAARAEEVASLQIDVLPLAVAPLFGQPASMSRELPSNLIWIKVPRSGL
ncbi:hypothetical protein BMJ32_13510 [Sinorhizobium medicae]|nr:hypothetical protein BMJ32_13510 [Sinorhizobium medicae]PLU10639.1 hypothetical protein BMJ31_30490 [Sinorhizobium medicae]PLU33503.1 hypothetical protein BMJ28_20360 [Sinorhizobium medicae]PLU33763.1 hypothetical protein BMJ26_23420 [Sinorhizobium medicae]PLU36942.1 hypothetical protein BMJ27_08790 [Sinorhizobium medicae]